MTVKPEDYMIKLVEYGIMKITAVCSVESTNQSWFEEDDFQIIKPVLKIEVKEFLYFHFKPLLGKWKDTLST